MICDPAGWTEATTAAVAATGLDPAVVAAVVSAGLTEDLRDGPDVTTEATVPWNAVGRAQLTPRAAGVLAGVPLALAVFDTVMGGAPFHTRACDDGIVTVPGSPVLEVVGPVRALLTAERTALNLLGHLSGIATATRVWVDAVAGTGTRIRDTRKTMPGLRALQKYAVRCGGGVNHRMSLGDAPLIKDNHVAAAGSVTAAVHAVRSLHPAVPMEVEVDTLAQFDEALAAGAELVLLDNFTLADTAEAVRRRDSRAPSILLEASGGLAPERAAALAAAGVDYLAVGALTHSSAVLDLGMELIRIPGTDTRR